MRISCVIGLGEFSILNAFNIGNRNQDRTSDQEVQDLGPVKKFRASVEWGNASSFSPLGPAPTALSPEATQHLPQCGGCCQAGGRQRGQQ